MRGHARCRKPRPDLGNTGGMAVTISPLAGNPAPKEILVDVGLLEQAYYEQTPDLDNADQLVSFGTSGHRGSPFAGSFTEAHVLAITQAICDYRRAQGITGPLYLGKDTHGLSSPAQRTALEVLAAYVASPLYIAVSKCGEAVAERWLTASTATPEPFSAAAPRKLPAS